MEPRIRPVKVKGSNMSISISVEFEVCRFILEIYAPKIVIVAIQADVMAKTTDMIWTAIPD